MTLLPVINLIKPVTIVAQGSRELATKLWGIFKTLLFLNIMVVQVILTTLTYTSPPPSSSALSPHYFALSALQVFSHLSFVLPQFGGVASTAQGGFVELKKVFYAALDILSADRHESEMFVKALSGLEIRGTIFPPLTHITPCCGGNNLTFEDVGKSAELPSHVYHAKKAYTLACVEQLVPVLNDECIRDHVYPMCSP